MSHQFRGNSARRRRRRAGFSQASTRRPITLYDQHGREWSAQVGNKTGMPTGQIAPNFHAPWYPDQQYLKVNPDNTAELFIDYEPMLVRRMARNKEYHKRAVDAARELKMDPPKFGVYGEAIRNRVGGVPKPVEPIVAAMQGNKYILGLTKKVDQRLVRFVTVATERDTILSEYDFAEEGRSFADAKASRNNAVAGAELQLESSDEELARVADEGFDAFDSAMAETRNRVADESGDDDLDVDEILGGVGTEEEEDEQLEHHELEEAHDAAAIGGRTVKPGNEERVARQAPRRPASKTARKTNPKKKGPQSAHERQKAAQRGNRPTLATGAKPVIAGGGL